jgi:hypothetical protein
VMRSLLGGVAESSQIAEFTNSKEPGVRIQEPGGPGQTTSCDSEQACFRGNQGRHRGTVITDLLVTLTRRCPLAERQLTQHLIAPGFWLLVPPLTTAHEFRDPKETVWRPLPNIRQNGICWRPIRRLRDLREGLFPNAPNARLLRWR